MTLRLVLVGMVAALGVSIPSQPSPDRWFDSAESWATSLLAEWDTWEPTDGNGTGPAGKGDHLDCEECRLAQLRLASNAMRAAAGDPPAPNSEAVAACHDHRLERRIDARLRQPARVRRVGATHRSHDRPRNADEAEHAGSVRAD